MFCRKRYTKIAFSFIICCTLFLFLFGNYSSDNKIIIYFYGDQISVIQLSEKLPIGIPNACLLPLNLNPFDESIRHLIRKSPDRVVCKKENDQNLDLTLIDVNGTLKMASHVKNDTICFYQIFKKMIGDDDKVAYQKKQVLDPVLGFQMGNDNFVNVTCTNISNNKINYENAHFWFNTNEKLTAKESDENVNSPHPSVFVLVIESLSRINYLRFMNKTRSSFESMGDVVYLKGLTKIASNSFPNMVPLLTGKRAYKNELPNESGPFDKWPFIWKNFNENGYKTLLLEELSGFTLFNFVAKGFNENPTDFYPHPYWLHLDNSVKNMKFESGTCFREKTPYIDIFFDQAKHFINKCVKNSDPYFAFTFLIEITHHNFNAVKIIDPHVSRFIQEMSHQLKDAIFILMGDHGMRFGKLVETEIGRIEDRMPLFSIRLPKSLKIKHNHLQSYLESNSDKLATWLDVHQLLLDVAKGNFSPKKSFSGSKPAYKSAYSPWREHIPNSRTCQDALIPEEYCVCKRKILNISGESVMEASHALVAHINNLVPHSLCQTMSLNNTVKAEAFLEFGSISQTKQLMKQIEITVSVDPSDAIFRAQLSRTGTSDWKVIGEVDRINKYGNQSHCIDQRLLKPFCYCFH